mgnify:CR=1 FL=1
MIAIFRATQWPILALLVLLTLTRTSRGDQVVFSRPPTATALGDAVKIRFAASAATSVDPRH